MCIGGRIGADIDLDGTGNCDAFARLWGESLGRIIIAVSKDNQNQFLQIMAAIRLHYLARVTQSEKLTINDGFETLVDCNVEDLVSSWKGTLDMTGAI